jgi:hypothetical protein
MNILYNKKVVNSCYNYDKNYLIILGIALKVGSDERENN